MRYFCGLLLVAAAVSVSVVAPRRIRESDNEADLRAVRINARHASTLRKPIFSRNIGDSHEKYEKRDLTEDDLKILFVAALIAADIEQAKREPTTDEAGVLLAAGMIVAANEDDLRQAGFFDRRKVGKEAELREVGSAESRKVANKDTLRANLQWRRQLETREDE